MFVTLTQFRVDQVNQPEQKVLIRASAIKALWPREQHYCATEEDRKKVIKERPVATVVDVEYTNTSTESDGCVTVTETLATIQNAIYWTMRDEAQAIAEGRLQAQSRS
jgi:hypothetical protein